MKHYMIHRGQFGNVYDLAWVDNLDDRRKLLSMGFENCSRKYAEQMARRERERRAMDPAFSGYASNAIYPAPYYLIDPDANPNPETYLIRNYELKGVIWE